MYYYSRTFFFLLTDFKNNIRSVGKSSILIIYEIIMKVPNQQVLINDISLSKEYDYNVHQTFSTTNGHCL